jgi:hypothetical protein
VRDGDVVRQIPGSPDVPFHQIADHYPVTATITLPPPGP